MDEQTKNQTALEQFRAGYAAANVGMETIKVERNYFNRLITVYKAAMVFAKVIAEVKAQAKEAEEARAEARAEAEAGFAAGVKIVGKTHFNQLTAVGNIGETE